MAATRRRVAVTRREGLRLEVTVRRGVVNRRAATVRRAVNRRVATVRRARRRVGMVRRVEVTEVHLRAMGGDVNTTLPLVLNIIGIFIGCCTYGIGSIFAIIGLIMTILAMNTKATDPEGARGKAKLGTIFGIVALVIGPILFVVFMALGMFASVVDSM